MGTVAEFKQKKKKKPSKKLIIKIIESLLRAPSFAAKMTKSNEIGIAATEITAALKYLLVEYPGLLSMEVKPIPENERKNSKKATYYSIANKDLANNILAELRDSEKI